MSECLAPGPCSCCGTEGWNQAQLAALHGHYVDGPVRTLEVKISTGLRDEPNRARFYADGALVHSVDLESGKVRLDIRVGDVVMPAWEGVIP